ncbi:Gfo/Idh/MocA family oxidoreductase [Microbacterium sp.]|uniref:Gfo/Idh/MocA family protein n=1 Tax=Microbacterium sp. TaxID=51671 RepID=UPI00333FDF6C
MRSIEGTPLMTTPTVLLVGARGFGAVHLENLERLRERADLIGLVDPAGPPEQGYGAEAPHWPSLDDAFAAGIRPDVVIVATPTGTHFSLAASALEHGADVYLEKPPVASMEQFDELLRIQERTGRAVQIGFQSLGSHALAEIAGLGEPTAIATWGAWTRDAAYWSRSSWAGRRSLDGAPIVDGVLTNALSHAIATALRIAGARRREDVARVELELLHAADIAADDTSAARITLRDGLRIGVALTLASATSSPPLVHVRTTGTEIVFSYTEDLLTDDSGVRRTGRTDLFEELLDHRERGTALTSALIDNGAYMEVLEAVRTAPDPRPIPEAQLDVSGEGASTVRAVRDASEWVERTARAGALFSEAGAPFAQG